MEGVDNENIRLQKDKFYDFLNDYLKSVKRKTSKIILKERASVAFETLKGIEHRITPNFKHFIKEKFCIIKSENGEEVLGRKINNTDVLQVGIYENYFDIIYNIHSNLRGHCGEDKTYEQVKLRYACIPRVAINAFIKFCPICNCKQVQTVQPRIRPIRSDQFWHRIQIDLIYMRNYP